MYIVNRIEDRPNTDVEFFRPIYTPELRAVLSACGASAEYEYSNNNLTCVITYTWPSEEQFYECVNNQIVIDEVSIPRDEYNLLNGISSTVETIL